MTIISEADLSLLEAELAWLYDELERVRKENRSYKMWMDHAIQTVKDAQNECSEIQ